MRALLLLRLLLRGIKNNIKDCKTKNYYKDLQQHNILNNKIIQIKL